MYFPVFYFSFTFRLTLIFQKEYVLGPINSLMMIFWFNLICYSFITIRFCWNYFILVQWIELIDNHLIFLIQIQADRSADRSPSPFVVSKFLIWSLFNYDWNSLTSSLLTLLISSSKGLFSKKISPEMSKKKWVN